MCDDAQTADHGITDKTTWAHACATGTALHVALLSPLAGKSDWSWHDSMVRDAGADAALIRSGGSDAGCRAAERKDLPVESGTHFLTREPAGPP